MFLSLISRCPPGFYCPSERTTFPSTCPKNYKCSGGTIDPQKCAFLTHSQVFLFSLLNCFSDSLLPSFDPFPSQEGATSCKESSLFYVMLFILLIVIVGSVFAVYKFWSQKSATSQGEQQGLIPRPAGPVYGWSSFLFTCTITVQFTFGSL